MKICSSCKQSKDVKEFAYKNKSKNIRQSQCKECHREYSNNHYQNNKNKYKSRAIVNNRKYSERNTKYVNDLKAKRGCKFCDENDPCCLDFHHTNNDKEYNVSNRAKSGVSLDNVKKEIAKCIIVCSNCHRKIHANKIVVK